MRHTLHVIALAVLIPAGASAQTTTTKAPVPSNQVLSMNPFLLIVSWVNGEYERRVSPTVTIGASASRFDFSDAGFAATGILTRWYPQGAALDGFYLGARLGAFRFKTHQYDYSTYTAVQPGSPTPASASSASTTMGGAGPIASMRSTIRTSSFARWPVSSIPFMSARR